MHGFRRTANKIALLAILLTVQFSLCAETGPDEIDSAWQARAVQATKNLSGHGLDACDQALERAFERPTTRHSDASRYFVLTVDIRGKKLLASYSYSKGRLDSFQLGALPPRWMVVQKTNSKTLNILLADEQCAFDLCATDPFSNGPCRNESR